MTGLFEKIGKNVERFKQNVEDAAQEEATYECRECGAVLYTSQEECPKCGADAVVAREDSRE